MSTSESRILREVPVAFARMGMMLSKYWNSDRRRARLKLLLEIRAERDMLLMPNEACQIMSAIDAVKRIPGDMAELGVARGASAKMMTRCAPERILHLFDTFDGIPEPGAEDSPRFKKHQYRFTLEEVQSYLKSDNCASTKGCSRRAPSGCPTPGLHSCTLTGTSMKAPEPGWNGSTPD